jgi:hypothetical protein
VSHADVCLPKDLQQTFAQVRCPPKGCEDIGKSYRLSLPSTTVCHQGGREQLSPVARLLAWTVNRDVYTAARHRGPRPTRIRLHDTNTKKELPRLSTNPAPQSRNLNRGATRNG